MEDLEFLSMLSLWPSHGHFIYKPDCPSFKVGDNYLPHRDILCTD